MWYLGQDHSDTLKYETGHFSTENNRLIVWGSFLRGGIERDIGYFFCAPQDACHSYLHEECLSC